MADILIRGMEMPKDCSYCKMAYDGAWCLLSEESNDCVEGGMMWRKCPYGGRPSWCPLVPLPEGHGRLIDAERFRVILCRLKDRMVDDEAIHAVQWAIECLDKLDTIVPAEGGTDNA